MARLESSKFHASEGLFDIDNEEFNENPVNTGNISDEMVMDIELDDLVPFFNHPYSVVEDDEMKELSESVKINGILNPLLARPIADGGFEIISGHRRLRAAYLAELKTVPVLIKELSDDEACIAMVDSNMARENIKISEKAKAFKIKMDAMNRQGKKNADGTKINSAEEIGEASGNSKCQVFRYLRLNYLTDEWLQMVDEKKIPAFTTGNYLSFLSVKEQNSVYSFYLTNGVLPTSDQSLLLKKMHKDLVDQGGISIDKIAEVLMGKKKTKPKKLVLKSDFIEEYFPESTEEEMMEIIKLALKKYKESEEI